MTGPILSFKADLDGDGIPETEWGSYVLSFRGGIGRTSALDAFDPRKLTITLDNQDSRFSPRNASGPYYPNIRKRVIVQLVMVFAAPSAAFALFTGELMAFRTDRPDRIGIATYEATGLKETVTTANISFGPTVRTPADTVVRRLMDIIEASVFGRLTGRKGECMPDGARRYNGLGGNFSAVLGAFDSQVDARNFSLVDWLSLEGDNVMESVASGASNTFLWRFNGADVPDDVVPNTPYRVGIFAMARDTASVGKQVKLLLKNQAGTTFASSPDTTLPALAQWVYLEAQGTFPSGATELRIEGESVGSFTNPTDRVWWDCLHIAPIADAGATRITAPVFIGDKWADEIEYCDAYREKAAPVLEDVAKSVGGWIWERGDGRLVFEDYTQRDTAVVSTPVLELSDDPSDDALSYTLVEFHDPAASLCGTVRVSSYGNVQNTIDLGAYGRMCWTYGPQSFTLPAEEARLFFAQHASEGNAKIIGRYEIGDTLPPAATFAFVRVESYGRNTDVTVKQGIADSDIIIVRLFCLPFLRSTEKTMVRLGTAYGFDIDPVLDLEMPLQGTESQAMTDVATWARDRYSAGPATMKVIVVGDTDDHRRTIFTHEIGTPVHVKHSLGPGNFGVDALFYVEGVEWQWEVGEHPTVQYTLEEGIVVA